MTFISPQATINLDALQHNFQQVRQLAPTSRTLVMIKANAYGHGLLPIAKALSTADALGVARLDEALLLRQHDIKQRIVLMSGFNSYDELAIIASNQFDVIIHKHSQLNLLKNFSTTTPLGVWLKVDSAMHRLGFAEHEVADVYHTLRHCNSVDKTICLITHFSSAEATKSTITDKQTQIFNKITENLPGEKSLANSAAIIKFPHTHQDWVRPGIMLYGISPMVNEQAEHFNLRPVMTLTSRIIAIHRLRKGDAVGYNATWICPEDMSVGVVAIGYGDGYPRHAKVGTPILVNKQTVPLIGCVSMDMLTIDLRKHDNVKEGDPVTLWGEGLPITTVASYADTIAYELVCHVAARVRFVYSRQGEGH
ncbi:MAG: alanine racemase [Gammaproteobacteria bacterium]|nr:alanine racemase [Gammaproteobacteria bacterium]